MISLVGADEDRRAAGAGSGRATLIVAAACAAAALLLASAGTFAPLELALRDAALRLAPSRSPDLVAVVAIDESSLARLGPWPWPRDTLARLVQATADQGARAVVLDLLLVEATPTDELLSGALAAAPSVLAVGLGEG
ncbi:MAG: CHASE2 domain-containing protein, partial [Acidobacteriota bacterium]